MRAMSRKKTELTQSQKDDAARLRALLMDYMLKNNKTQSQAMDDCGWTQGMFAQICGSDRSDPHRALTHEQAFTLAKLLGVTIEKISPQIARDLLDMCSLVNLRIDKIKKKQRGSSSDSA